MTAKLNSVHRVSGLCAAAVLLVTLLRFAPGAPSGPELPDLPNKPELPKLVPEQPPATQRKKDGEQNPAASPAASVKPPDQVEPPALDGVTRVYNIRDLAFVVPHLHDPPDLVADQLTKRDLSHGSADDRSSFNLFAPTRKAGPDGERDQLVDDIVRLIQESIAPDTWRDTGGMLGSIKALGGQLIVTQTEENHLKIRQLFDQLREGKYQNVRIRAHWVVADRKDLEKILKPVPPSWSFFATTQPSKPLSRPVIEKSTVHSLLAASEDDLNALAGVASHFRAEALCLNGERVTSFAVRAQSAGRAEIAVSPAAARMKPGDNSVLSGLVLDAQPTLSFDASTVVVTVRGEWKVAKVEPNGTSTFRASAATQPSTLPVGSQSSATAEVTAPATRNDSRVHQTYTTISLPLGQMIFMGGATLDPAIAGLGEKAAADHAGASPLQLYLFIEVTAN